MSSAEFYAKAHQLFQDICDLPEEQRRVRLASLSVEHADLVARVEAMLRSDLGHNSDDTDEQGDTLVGAFEQTVQSVVRAPMPSIPGYQLIETLGSGGMGVVWRAIQSKTQREVAIKMVRHATATDEHAIARFDREVELAARLTHPNIAGVYDGGVSEGAPYCVMELIDGQELQDYRTENQLEQRELIELMVTVCDALHHAHQKGVVHRDIKPSNILVSPEGVPYIVDFGIATSLAEDQDTRMTNAGQLLGTLAYMSPEQAVGDMKKIDTRTDVYSTGLILYELVVGQHPRSEAVSHLEALQRIAEDDICPPRKLHPSIKLDLESILLKALQRDPNDRYAGMSEFADDMRRFLAWQPVEARRLGVLGKTVKACRRRPAAAGLTVAFALMLIVLGIGGPLVAIHQMRLLAEVEQERDRRHSARVNLLLTADVSELPTLLQEMEKDDLVDLIPRLRQFALETGTEDEQQFRLRLALAKTDPDAAHTLIEDLWSTDPDHLSAIRSVLQPQAVHLNERLWSRAVDVAANPEDRFRAACMLSTFDPDDPRWQNLAGITTTVLLEQDPISAGAWSRLLQPAAAWIFDAMATTFRMREEASALKKELTARLLVRFGSNRTLALCELIAEADRDEFIILFDALRASEEEVTPKLLEQLYQVSLKREANESDGLRNRPATEADLQTARRQSNLILALYRLGESEPLWDALRLTPNPTLRSWLITHLASIGADPNGLVKQLFNESNLSVSRALILCLGHYRPADLDEGHRNALMTRLHHDFATHRDPGVHSACDWTLRQWGVDVDAPENLQTSIGATEEDQSNKQDPLKRRELSEGQDTPGWFLDENGHTMVQFAGPIEFRSGILQKLDAPELATVPTFSRIGHGFAISTTEVTRQQFGEFVREMNFDFDFNAFDQIVGTSPTHPRTAVYYFDAAAYCNWLSKKAGLPSSEWCYEPALNGQWTIGSRTKANAIELRGYRLPTEMEWEYACRADASTAWSFGDEVELLSHYAWHRGNSNDQLQQVKQLLPNDFGLFDHHGNALELCINLFSKLDTRISDERSSDRHYQFPNASTTYLDIPTRGGWARDHARQLRAGSRNHSIGMNRILKNGFRIARTVSNDRETERVERKLGLPQPFRMPSERHHFLLPQVSFRDADSFTVEAWVQDWKGPLLSLGMNGPTSPRFTIGSLAVVWNQGNRPPQLARFRNAPPFGIHHRAVVYDGEALTVYLDGQVVAELTTNQVPDVSPDRPVFIGRVEGGANAFARGDLYLLEVSDTARYREPFRPEPRLRPDDHTLRFYDFSKIVGDRLPDLSRHQRHGTLLKTDRNGDAEH